MAQSHPTMSQSSLNHNQPHGPLAQASLEEEDAVLWSGSSSPRWKSLWPKKQPAKRVFERLPKPSQERLDESLSETPLNALSLSPRDIRAAEEKHKTVLYLAYGSNLCNETFRGRRGIKPLSQINVLVPSLRLTFDLPGFPYTEPCFANSAARDPSAADYHKNRWHKGLVGCVYEVTPSDYAHIIATEGGGASYEDILVECYALPDGDTVPDAPTSAPFKAHTLFAPVGEGAQTRARFARPDPAYAQPSARYLKLITDGAGELDLPREYRDYLEEIRPYRITSRRQLAGKALTIAVWMPIAMFLFGLGKVFGDEKGRLPKWLGKLMELLFVGIWGSYDGVFKKVFGDGERTDGERTDGDDADGVAWRGYSDLEEKGEDDALLGEGCGERKGWDKV